MIKIFTAFAGYGTDNFALKQLGIEFECVGFSEIDKYAIMCFEQNHKGKNYGDISKIAWNVVPDFDLIKGGFPCQDVSVAGKQDLNKGRTILGLELTKALRIKQPKYFLFENVKGLMSNHEFLVGAIVITGQQEHQSIKTDGISNALLSAMGEGRGHTPIVMNCLTEAQGRQGSSSEFLSACEKVALSLNPKFIDVYNNKVQDLCPTLTEPNHNSLRVFDRVFRRLTPKECFRLQGFLKDEVKLNGLSDTQAYRLAGNGQSVNVVFKILKELLKNGN